MLNLRVLSPSLCLSRSFLASRTADYASYCIVTCNQFHRADYLACHLTVHPGADFIIHQSSVCCCSFALLPPRLSSPAAQTVVVCLPVLHLRCVFSSPDILVPLLHPLSTPPVPLLRVLYRLHPVRSPSLCSSLCRLFWHSPICSALLWLQTFDRFLSLRQSRWNLACPSDLCPFR